MSTNSVLPPRAKRARTSDFENQTEEYPLVASGPMPTDPLGLFTLLRTYARRHNDEDPESTIETPEEIVRRVVLAGNSQLNMNLTPEEQKEAFDVIYNLKGTVAGRFLWQLGTKTVAKNGLISLQNCSYRTVGGDNDPVDPFTWTMNFLMCGSGVGFRILPEDVYSLPRIHSLTITRRDSNDADFIVPDSREGWIKLLGKVLKGHFYGADNFSYSLHCLRSKGAPIKGFGGVASGPEVLEDGINRIHRVLQARVGEKLRPIDCLDIQNIIGQIVVAGNVRRCLPGYARVHTYNGMKPISAVQIGDRVLGADRLYYSVVNVFVQGQQDIMEIATDSGTIRSTANHRHAVYNPSTGITYVPAEEITPGMYLCRCVHACGDTDGFQNIETVSTAGLDHTSFDWASLMDPLQNRSEYFTTIQADIANRVTQVRMQFSALGYRQALERIYSEDFLKGADLLAKSLGTTVYTDPMVWPQRISVGNRSFAMERVTGVDSHVDHTDTYDIEVDTVHEFFADGFLTHNSAEIALGDCRDNEYLLAKNWGAGNIPNWRSSSNNSVVCNDINDVIDNPTFWQGYNGTGEPYGLINLNLARSCGRLGETQYPDPDVQGVNPCLTGDTWVMTTVGPQMIYDLVGKSFTANLITETADCTEGFYWTKNADEIVQLTFSNGASIRCTPEHRFGCILDNNEFDWVAAADLHENMEVKVPLPLRRECVSWGKKCPSEIYNGYSASQTFIAMWEISGLFDLSTNLLRQSSGFLRGFLSGYIKKFGEIINDEYLKLVVPTRGSDSLNILVNVLSAFCVYADSVEDGESTGFTLTFDPYFTSYIVWFVVQRVKNNDDSYNDFWRGFLPRSALSNYTDADRDVYGYSVTIKQVEAQTLLVPMPVYDCGVPDTESFVANGVLTHNCGEQFLCDAETCCLAETFLPRHESYEDLIRTLKVLYRFCKHSLTLPCHASKKTEEIVHANMRMGIGMTGYLQATEEQKSWLSPAYEWLRAYDAQYSAAHGFPPSIKLSTCKPSGTLSLVGGTTPGVHPGFAPYYIRRVRISAESPLIEVARRHGLHVEYQRRFDGTQDPTTQIISFPVALPEGTVTASQVTAIQQLEYVRRLQTEWSDNAVSVTVYYRLHELDDIKEYLREHYNESIKSVSFLLHSDHGFDQAPMEEISEERYNEMVAGITPITDLTGICYSDADQQVVMTESACQGGACPTK